MLSRWTPSRGKIYSIRTLVRLTSLSWPHLHYLLTHEIANAVAQSDKLEFLQDIVPKTVTYKSVKDSAAVTRARLNGDHGTEEKGGKVNGKKQKKINGGGWLTKGPAMDDDPDAQLQMEARQAAGDDDVDMG
jgi:hypothetical protein